MLTVIIFRNDCKIPINENLTQILQMLLGISNLCCGGNVIWHAGLVRVITRK
jgi:hypothetical protein